MTEPITDDAGLIAAYRRGDDAALNALVQRHQAGVYRLAAGVLGSPQDAEDATQEALMAMLASLHRFRGEARFSTWLYRLTLNTCLKRRRGRREQVAAAAAADAPDLPDARPDVQAGRSWARERVQTFLAALPDGYRLPVVLSDSVNLTAPEIAALLGISLSAAKARILRGRQRLREEIDRYCRESGLSGWRELVSE